MSFLSSLFRTLFTTLLIALFITLGVAVGPVQAAEWDWLAPDAVALIKPVGDLADTVDALSWVVARPWAHRIWLDAFIPFADAGVGLSVDVQRGGPLCAGTGYLDGSWIGYIGGHMDVTW